MQDFTTLALGLTIREGREKPEVTRIELQDELQAAGTVTQKTNMFTIDTLGNRRKKEPSDLNHNHFRFESRYSH